MDFADLYSRYSKDVFRFAYYLTANRELAEDIAAETFVRVLTVRDEIQPGSVKAYLLAVARHMFVDWTRTRGRTTPLEDELLRLSDPAPDPEVQATGRIELEAARDALQQLPEPERAALLMAAVDELPHQQIAAALGCSPAAVRVRIHRARLRLRNAMAASRSGHHAG